jgi:amino acid transporter
VLAEAAKPMIGQLGFTIITIAALISVFSAINATLYGGSRVSFRISKDDELPHALTGQLWNHPVGLMITALAALVLVNTVNLESISTAGSAGFILIFSLVNWTGFKLSKSIHGNKVIPMAGFILGLVAFLALIVQQYGSNRLGVILALSIIALCFLAEIVYKKTGAHG